MNIRTRFAPSPTGQIHIGNLRTVIFNWIFTKKHKGKMFLRIEDTHEERCLKAHEDLIFQMLHWLSLDFDNCFDDEIIQSQHFKYEGQSYIKQSDYKSEYQKYAYELYNKNFAYYCICDSIEMRCNDCRSKNHTNGVLRFKTPENQHLEHNDMVFGTQIRNSNDVEDFALLRSNGDPTYMLCVVVDDHFMEISHVIRGEDHRTNTFKQILIYNAFHWNVPIFAHLPMVKDESGKKMSKRNNDSNSEIYKNDGIISEALFNILLRLGWGYKNEEIISKNRIIEIFEMSQVRKSPTMFDKKKLYSFSAKYLRLYDYRKCFINFIREKYEPNIQVWQIEAINKMYDELVKRCSTFNEIYNYVKFLFYWEKHHSISNKLLINILNNIENWEYNEIKSSLSQHFNSENLKQILSELRLVLTNSEFSIDIIQIIEIIGKQEVLNRLIV